MMFLLSVLLGVDVNKLGSDDFDTRELTNSRIVAALPYSAPLAWSASLSNDVEIARRGESILRDIGVPLPQDVADEAFFCYAVYHRGNQSASLPWADQSVHEAMGKDPMMRARFARWVKARFPETKSVAFAFDPAITGWSKSPWCLGLNNLRFHVRGIDLALSGAWNNDLLANMIVQWMVIQESMK